MRTHISLCEVLGRACRHKYFRGTWRYVWLACHLVAELRPLRAPSLTWQEDSVADVLSVFWCAISGPRSLQCLFHGSKVGRAHRPSAVLDRTDQRQVRTASSFATSSKANVSLEAGSAAPPPAMQKQGMPDADWGNKDEIPNTTDSSPRARPATAHWRCTEPRCPQVYN